MQTDPVTAGLAMTQTLSSQPGNQAVATGQNTSPAANAAAKAVQPASTHQLQSAADVLNKMVEKLAANLNFSVDQSTRELVVKVVDVQTNEVIRQIPSQEALDMARAFDQLQGLIIRQKA